MMNLQDLKKIIQKNLRYIVLFPFLLSLVVVIFTLNAEKKFLSAGIVYTGLASGYSITTEENRQLDFFAVNNAFDNLISTVLSRETIEETAMRLMALHLSFNKPSKAKLSERSFNELQNLLPESLRKQLKGHTVEETYQNINRYKEARLKNEITEILTANSGTYSLQQIKSSLKAERKNTSDMLELSFTANDPAVAKQTLTILIDVFIRRYKHLKSKETINVVKWFEDQLSIAQDKLKRSEENLKRFSIENKIINFQEQTKVIAEAREETLNEREREKNRIAAANANRTGLENKIKLKKDVYRINEEISSKRKMLSELQYKIANAEVLRMDLDKIPRYKAEAEQLKNSIDKQLNELHQYNSDPSGVSREALLNNWLDNSLEADGAGSKLNVIDSRLNSFDQIYNKYAPLGAALNGLEREVQVAEKEYLSTLNGLNQAKLRRQNIEMTNNLSTLDAPFFPLKAQPSKRIILVMLSFIAGTLLIIAFFVARYLLDNSIKNADNASRYTGSEVLAALPDFSIPEKKGVYREELKDNVFNHILGSLSLKFLAYNIHGRKPKYLNIYSHYSGEGARWFAANLARHMKNKGNNVSLFIPETSIDQYPESSPEFKYLTLCYYPITKDFVFVEHLGSLAYEDFDPDKFDFIINILPPFKDQQIPAKVLENGEINILVLDARRVWTPFDKYLNDLCKKFIIQPPLVVLNHTDIYNLELVYGQVTEKKIAPELIAETVEIHEKLPGIA